jgi:hypothetical protein
MVDSGLAQHGWTYCNTDDGWQGVRGGELNAIQPDGRDFPDIAAMVREIHSLGLKAGIYSSPWVTTYDRHIGSSSDDPDMLVIGVVGWGRPHPTLLTPDEQYTQISMWSLLSAPLLLGCDLQKLDPFTYSLISNDDVLDVDQDSLGKQATGISKNGDISVYAKPLDDGRWAVGLFNSGTAMEDATLKFSDLKLSGQRALRDLWRQKDLGEFDGEFSTPVAPHGVVLLAVSQK